MSYFVTDSLTDEDEDEEEDEDEDIGSDSLT